MPSIHQRPDSDPVLFEHMFWFHSHPAVYIMVLPGMGVISEIVPAFAQKKLFGYRFVAYASIGLASVTFFVWGRHMFANGESDTAALVFSLLFFAVAAHSAVKVYNWTATIYKGSIRLKTPMLGAMGYIGPFVLGGLHFSWPKLTGRMYPEGWGVVSAVFIFVGFNVTFFP